MKKYIHEILEENNCQSEILFSPLKNTTEIKIFSEELKLKEFTTSTRILKKIQWAIFQAEWKCSQMEGGRSRKKEEKGMFINKQEEYWLYKNCLIDLSW